MSSARRYERIAAFYDPLDLAEHLFKRQVRPEIFAGLEGCILEVGAGTGCNVPYYPAKGRVISVDGSFAMLDQARARAEREERSVSASVQDAAQLAFDDNEFDAVVATWLFGVIPDAEQQPALAELARVCRPGGEIRIIDYTLAQNRFRRFLMQVFWAPYQTVVMKCSFNCRPERHLAAAGLSLVRETYIYSDFIRMLIVTPNHAAEAPTDTQFGDPIPDGRRNNQYPHGAVGR
jgi:ubiquinone/menaquinone biosynthesis C-methylase UbiE